MSSAGIVAHSIFGNHVWFAGPLAVNGASGGSQNYYKRTEDLTDWSSELLPLPLSKTDLRYLCAVHRAVFMMFDSGNSIVSLNGGVSWTECNVELDYQSVQWNGRIYVCGERLSSDGITWSTLPNLTGNPLFTRARNSDGLIICGYSLDPDTRFEYTYDDGASWTVAPPPAGGYDAESLFGITISNRTSRIHYSIGSPFGANVVNRYTDDLFATDYPYAVSTQGLYEGRYGCSHLIQYEFSGVLALSTDGGWSSREVLSLTTDLDKHWLDFGDNQWAIVNRTALGNPDTYSIKYSDNGGLTWVTGTTLYGDEMNIAYLGTVGNCAIYSKPDYKVITNNELFSGDLDDLEWSAERAWTTNQPCVSADKEYILHNTNTDAETVLYKRTANGYSYSIITDELSPAPTGNGHYAISPDNQYFIGAIPAADGKGLWAFRQEDGIFTSLTVPGLNNTGQRDLRFHHTRPLLGTCDTDNNVARFYLFSGTTMSGPYNSPGLLNPGTRVAFSPIYDHAVVRTTGNRVIVLDIADPAGGVTTLATANGTAANSGNTGLYFTADGTGVLTISQSGTDPANIHHRSWDGATLGSPTLIGTAVYRALESDLTQDGRYLIVCKDITSNYLEVFHLSEDGTSILSSYVPALNSVGSASTVRWMGV
jgi:hypothetical protein